MKFTKLTVLALVLALLVCVFVACGGGAETEAETDAETNAPGTETETETEGETEHVHDIEVQVEAATCSERGYEREICKTCGETVSVNPIPMVDHVAKDGANCTTDAVCKFCETVISAAPGHTFGEATVTKEATCEAEGEKARTCSVCNEKETEAIAKLAHVIAAPTAKVEPTLEVPGSETGVCSLCNKEVTQTVYVSSIETFDGLEEGVLSADILNAAGNIAGFTATVKTPEAFTVVAEGDNKILVRQATTSATLYFEDTTGLFNTKKFEISFDYRMDSKATSSSIIALNNRSAGNNDEMRLLSTMSTSAGSVINFGTANSSGTTVVDGIVPEEGKWINFRIVVDPTTVNYEVYVNGSKVLYTTSDETAEGGHLTWRAIGGEWQSTSKPGYATDAQSPFTNVDGKIKGIYMFHYGGTACAIDNLSIALVNE